MLQALLCMRRKMHQCMSMALFQEYEFCYIDCRGETRALIGGGGVNIHIFLFCPTNFFWNQLSLRLISKEIRRAEHEYMNIQPPN